MRVLLDTDVLICAMLFKGLQRLLLRTAVRGEIVLVASSALLDEVEDVLIGAFAFGRTIARLTRGELEALADLVQPPNLSWTFKATDDEEILSDAVAGRVDTIVTKDRALLALKAHRGIRILTPREFANLWQESKS